MFDCERLKESGFVEGTFQRFPFDADFISPTLWSLCQSAELS